MDFDELPIQQAFCIALHPQRDERGSFERLFCMKEFERLNLQSNIQQVNRSHNNKSGTFRGMHFQTAPHEEAKLVQCIQGKIYDVILDLRSHSPSYMKWHAVELAGDDSLALYIPEGVAHGFLTLEDHSTVLYHMFHDYHADHASGVRWNDPAFGIKLPFEPDVISDKDAQRPLYQHTQQK